MPNKIYAAPETAIVFADSGGDATLTLASLANGAGRISTEYDRGTGSKPALYRWQLRFRSNATPTAAPTNCARLYLVTRDDTTYRSGGLGATDAAVSSETFLNLTDFLGSAEVTEASTSRDFVRQGFVWIRSRYISVAVWNGTGQAFHATASNNEVRLIPVPDEVQ